MDVRVLTSAAGYCERRRAMLLVDGLPRKSWRRHHGGRDGSTPRSGTSKNAAVFFPRLRQPNPLADNQAARPSRRAARSPA